MSAAARPGPKRKLTDTDRKRRKQEANEHYNYSKKYIGSEIVRWNHLKEALQVKSHVLVAKALLDRFVSSRPNRYTTPKMFDI